MECHSFRSPGIPISRHKMNTLKDSAILSLKDFNRMKNSSNFPSLTTDNTINTLSHSSLSPQVKSEINFNKAIDLKKRIINYDRRKKELNDLLSENKKSTERYPGVKDDDEAVRMMDKMCLYARISTIRDKQLKEKKELEKIFKKKEIEKRGDNIGLLELLERKPKNFVF